MSTATFRIAVTEQENKKAFVSKKKNILTNSARKPLSDRTTNETPIKQGTLSLPIKPKSTVKSTPKISHKISEKMYPDWCADICSYKQVEDTPDYIIWPKSERIDLPKFFKSTLNPTTPPPKFKDDIGFLPELMQLPTRNDFECPNDYITEVDIIDVDVPNYFF